MESKILQLYQILHAFKEGVYSLKTLKIEKNSPFFQQIETLFSLSTNIEFDKITLNSDGQKKIDAISNAKLKHIRFVESFRDQEKNNNRRKLLNDHIEFLYEKIFSLTSTPSDVINWALEHENFDLKILSIISSAIRNHISIGIRYFSRHSGETSLRKLNPYFLKYYRGQVYLIAHCYKHKNIRTFLLSRIRGITKTYDHFNVPIDISPENIFRYSVGIYIGDQEAKWIHLKCENHLLPILKNHPIHEKQQILLNNKNYFAIKVQLIITDELIRKLMQFGSNIEVVYPNTLRDDILCTVEKMRKIYS